MSQSAIRSRAMAKLLGQGYISYNEPEISSVLKTDDKANIQDLKLGRKSKSIKMKETANCFRARRIVSRL